MATWQLETEVSANIPKITKYFLMSVDTFSPPTPALTMRTFVLGLKPYNRNPRHVLVAQNGQSDPESLAEVGVAFHGPWGETSEADLRVCLVRCGYEALTYTRVADNDIPLGSLSTLGHVYFYDSSFSWLTRGLLNAQAPVPDFLLEPDHSAPMLIHTIPY